MTEIKETRLPGVGIRFEFPLENDDHAVIISHNSGRAEIMLCSQDDPDVCREVLRLTKGDVKALAEVLSQSRVTEAATMRPQLLMEGLTIDWVSVDAASSCGNCTLHDIEHQDEEAASIVAILRDGKMTPVPPSSFVVKPGDIAVVVGTPEGAEALGHLLRSG
ncbi:MAG TPA: TrkA C-terminal domain-containing protein [Thermoleophilia bacterium]|jgi:TrkA domain protein|nr:TrkA C-terminal domain-containing protein [Thermoleophilia bacterium]